MHIKVTMRRNANKTFWGIQNTEEMMQLFGGTAVVGDGNINLNDRQSEDWKERIRNLGGCVFF